MDGKSGKIIDVATFKIDRVIIKNDPVSFKSDPLSFKSDPCDSSDIRPMESSHKIKLSERNYSC